VALDEIVMRYTAEPPIDAAKLVKLRAELKESGLGEYFPDALTRLAAPNDTPTQIR
jgi:hypothetical protein